MEIHKFSPGKMFKKYVVSWFLRAPSQKRDRLLFYNVEYIFLAINFKKRVHVF